MKLLLEVYETVNWSEMGESRSMRASLEEKLPEIYHLLNLGPRQSSFTGLPWPGCCSLLHFPQPKVTGKNHEVQPMVEKCRPEHSRPSVALSLSKNGPLNKKSRVTAGDLLDIWPRASLCVCTTILGMERTDALQRGISVTELRRLAFAFAATVSIGDR